MGSSILDGEAIMGAKKDEFFLSLSLLHLETGTSLRNEPPFPSFALRRGDVVSLEWWDLSRAKERRLDSSDLKLFQYGFH
jgi:hypothetical protein